MKKLLAALLCILSFGNIINVKAFQVTPTDSLNEEIKLLREENKKLKNIMDKIIPKEDSRIYENPYRSYGDWKPSFKDIELEKVIEKGKNVKFDKIYNNSNYNRPVYDPSWKDFYFRGWLHMPVKTSEAGHRLFIYPIGGSAGFDLTGSLGLDFEGRISIDAFTNLNFIVYGFDVKEIKQYKNQVALIGRPSRTGVQVISIVQDNLLLDKENEKLFLFQLATPEGYEIDFIYSNVIKYKYLQELIKKNTVGIK